MELSTIIGIVVAVVFIVIALKMIFSKSADPSSEDQSLHVHPETNLPVVPRHLRVTQTEQIKVSNEKIEPTLSDTVLAQVDDQKQSALTDAPAHTIETTETLESKSVKASEPKKAEAVPAEPHLIIAERVSKAENVQSHQETVDVDSSKHSTKVSADDTATAQVTPETTSSDQDSLVKATDSSAALTPNKPTVAISTEVLEDWEGESSILDLHLTEQERHDEESALACAEHIVALYVWPNPSRALSGEKALKILLKYGLRYGEMQCFHRYQQVEETSPLMFSVLRLTNEGPAGFDLESLSTEQVNGLAFFLALPNAHAGLGFDSMASIANHIAKEVDGKVYDENGQELTAQLREHWRHQVIEFRSGQDMTAVG